MTLKSIFEKPVDRPIEGVIKADDEASLYLEVEEYVLTREIEKRLDAFLNAYNHYEGANGVWISGFFGSGKSHLLKMLALLMENREIEAKKVLDLFLPKCGDNEMLRSDLKKAVAIPSKSILFNIDQKADVISKKQIDALLAVFVKVFDESCGYYGKQPYIAQFERELDRDGLFHNFRTEFKRLSSHEWEWGRRRAKRVASFIDAAYERAAGQAVSAILDKYRSDYRLSIEDFAEQVNRFIEQQEAGFRLIFFVDEVGQYVADNVKLMTNLQTIAESLATKSRGRAWIVVTAQEDMDSVVGEMDRRQSNDFSKIQARFAIRMKLTSADVAEVIQKRLLLKNEAALPRLSQLYDEQSNNFKTLFDFGDGSQLYRNFRGQDHFIRAYPFAPYQFTLFQTAIQTLSVHNAFEGRHRSVGERSMLGVFRQVAVLIADQAIGRLASFDLMFEGIRSALKARIQRAVLIAEKHLENRFAVKVLKALFLVKYIKEFKATRRNLAVLMLDGFGKDMDRLHTDLTEALDLLEQQTYIRRNGDLYEFLTDEEKDVEEEIKATEVETDKVAEQLSRIVFNGVIKHKKIRYDENGRDYPFSKKLDDRLFGREYELSIHIISPFHEHSENEQTLAMQSAGRDELLVVIPPDDRMIRDLVMYEKTGKYIRQNMSVTRQESVKRILADKGEQNRERLKDLEQHIHQLLVSARLYINVNLLETGEKDPQTRIVRGFHDLIVRTYPNLKMLSGVSYTEGHIAKCLKREGDALFKDDPAQLSEAEQEMLSYIKQNKNSGVRTTLKSLIERFERKSYGWYYAAILCILAKLCAAEKIEVSADGIILEDDPLEKALRNTRQHTGLVLTPLADFTAGQVRNLKEFYEDFFDVPPAVSDARALGKETALKIGRLIETLSALKSTESGYPFFSVVEEVIETLEAFREKPYSYYLTELHRFEDDLLDVKEDVMDPLRQFMNGPLRNIYDEAAAFLEQQGPNFTYIEENEHTAISEILKDAGCYKSGRMQQVKSLVASVSEKVAEKRVQTRQEAADTVSALLSKMNGIDEFAGLSPENRKKLAAPFEKVMQEVADEPLIAVIRDRRRSFEEDEYPEILSGMSRLAQPKPEPTDSGDWTTPSGEKGNAGVSEPKMIAARAISVDFDKAWLADETDIDHYLDVLREAMRREISEGKRIQV